MEHGQKRGTSLANIAVLRSDAIRGLRTERIGDIEDFGERFRPGFHGRFSLSKKLGKNVGPTVAGFQGKGAEVVFARARLANQPGAAIEVDPPLRSRHKRHRGTETP